ncbi:unnamed protein product [Gemmataceae bacterium]|nr:unnamed protein product [Gemmataceae bacterium]VTU01267.1 unnamed protein product [Gemmataceae bacterium]
MMIVGIVTPELAMRTRLLVLLLAAAAVALSPAPALAHDLRLVVKLPPDEPTVVVLEAGFDDDTPAEAAAVSIVDAEQYIVAEGKTDDRGVCRLPRPGPGKYTAKAVAIGHRDRVPFEVPGPPKPEAPATDAAPTEYRGWRPDQTLGLWAGVGGLLLASGAYWWLRGRKSFRPEN